MSPYERVVREWHEIEYMLEAWRRETSLPPPPPSKLRIWFAQRFGEEIRAEVEAMDWPDEIDG